MQRSMLMVRVYVRLFVLLSGRASGASSPFAVGSMEIKLAKGTLLAHSARADMYRRLGRTAEARSSYEKALALTQQQPERQFLQERIRPEADADIEMTRRKA
jgi:predicted RNA polymerase sigma factor